MLQYGSHLVILRRYTVSEFKPDIWRLQAQFNTQGLVTALSNDDAGVRRRAAAALRALGAFHTIPDLKKALERETDEETRATLDTTITMLQQEKDGSQRVADLTPSKVKTLVEQLIEKLKSTQNSSAIIRIARALGEIGDKQAVESLVLIFNNTEVPIKVRLAVAEALLKLESAPVEVSLLGALRSPEWRVRRNGAAILGQLRATWAVEPLATALRDENEIVRRTALAALRNIGTKEAGEAIEAVRQSLAKKSTKTSKTVSADSAESPTTSPPADDKAPDVQWPDSKKQIDIQASMVTKPLDPGMVDRLDLGKKTDSPKKSKTESDDSDKDPESAEE
jgi:hypothetical protein